MLVFEDIMNVLDPLQIKLSNYSHIKLHIMKSRQLHGTNCDLIPADTYMGSALILLNGGLGMSVGVLSFVKLKERGVSVRFYFSFFPLWWRASPFCLPELRSGQARPARHEAAPAAHHQPITLV